MKYKFTILVAVLFTIPLVGYFMVNGYWWLFDGNNPDQSKMMVAFFAGSIALTINVAICAFEVDQ